MLHGGLRRYVTRTTLTSPRKPSPVCLLALHSNFISFSSANGCFNSSSPPFLSPNSATTGECTGHNCANKCPGDRCGSTLPVPLLLRTRKPPLLLSLSAIAFHFHALITYRVIFSSLSSLSFHPILRSSVECSGENCACECTGPECGHECTGPNCGPNACCPGRAKNTAGECVAITTTTSTSTSTSTSQNFFGKSGTGSRMRFEPAPDSFITVSSQSLFDLLTPDLISAAVRYRTTLTPPCKPASVCLLALSCHLHYISMHIFSFPSLKHGA